MKYLTKLLTLLALLTLPLWLSAQLGNFGRNKPNYEKFDFKVYQSPNFELYTYLDNEEWRQNFLNASEEWYRVHQSIFGDTIDFRNPLVIYADHADFQQTNTINGAISTGVGGVTEAFKNRVIMPVAHTNQQTHHVLGHELVHAFQFDVVIRGIALASGIWRTFPSGWWRGSLNTLVSVPLTPLPPCGCEMPY
jgi:hypothetical protein